MTPLWAPNVQRLLARRDSAGLVEALHHKDAAVRREAAAALGTLAAAAGLAPLLAATADPDAEVREQALRALHDSVGAVGGWRALPVLADAVRQPERRALAVQLLGELGEPGAVPPLLDLCDEPRPAPAVIAALVRISRASGRDALEVERLAMLVGTRPADPFRLRAIAAVLAALDEPGFVGPLLESVSATTPAIASAGDAQAEQAWSALRQRDDPQQARDYALALLWEHREAAVTGLVDRLRGPLGAGPQAALQAVAYAWLDELVDERDLGLLRTLLTAGGGPEGVAAARLVLWRATAASLPARAVGAITDGDLATLADMLVRGDAAMAAQATQLLGALAQDPRRREAVSVALVAVIDAHVVERLVAQLDVDVAGLLAAPDGLDALREKTALAAAAATLLPALALKADVVAPLAAALQCFGVLAPLELEEALERVGSLAALAVLDDYRQRYGAGRDR